jgi:hypothetical protein
MANFIRFVAALLLVPPLAGCPRVPLSPHAERIIVTTRPSDVFSPPCAYLGDAITGGLWDGLPEDQARAAADAGYPDVDRVLWRPGSRLVRAYRCDNR